MDHVALAVGYLTLAGIALCGLFCIGWEGWERVKGARRRRRLNRTTVVRLDTWVNRRAS